MTCLRRRGRGPAGPARVEQAPATARPRPRAGHRRHARLADHPRRRQPRLTHRWATPPSAQPTATARRRADDLRGRDHSGGIAAPGPATGPLQNGDPPR